MGKADYLALGDYNAQCYECGRKFKASELLRHWQGYYVCKEHWEPRQPQDFARAVPDVQTPPWAQPMPTDTYVIGGAGITSAGGVSRAGASGVIIPGDGITTADRFIPDAGTASSFTDFTSAATIISGGTGYTEGDTLVIVGGTGTASTVIVTAVDGSGEITEIINGTVGDYTAAPTCSANALLHFDGANGATTTVDEAGHAVTIATGSQLSTTQEKFGSASLVMDALVNPGSVNRGAVLDGITTLGTAGWTIECWWYNPTGTITWRLVTAGNGSEYLTPGYGVMVIWSDVGVNFSLYLSSNGTSWDLANASGVAGVSMNAGWNHVAVTFDNAAGHYYTYVNGVKKHDVTSSSTICDISRIWITPSDYNGSSLLLTAWIDEWLLSSTCRYPGGTTFTPPTSAFIYSSANCIVEVSGGTGTGASVTYPTIATVNWATYNPGHAQSYLSLQNSNLLAQSTASPEFVSAWTVTNVGSTVFQQTGETGLLRYCEFTDPFGNGFDLASVANLNYFGLIKSDFVPTDNTFIGSTSDSYGISTGGLKWNNNSSTVYGSSCNAVPLVVGLLFDSVNGTLAVMLNGLSYGTVFTGISGSYCPAISLGIGRIIIANFGASAWTYDPPTGYVGWTG